MEENWVLTNNEKFLCSEKQSDVTFSFGEDKLLHAHSHHLAFASEVFETQIFGVIQERRIEIKDVTFEAFRTFIRFIYTGELQLSLENMFELAYLGKKYIMGIVTELVKAFFLEKVKDANNFWALFRPIEIEYFDNGKKSCLTRLTGPFEKSPLSYLEAEKFVQMDEEIVGEVVRNENLQIKEFDLYKAVLRWAEHRCKGDRSSMRKLVGPFIHSLRLPTLSWSELTTDLQTATGDLLSQEEKQSLLSYYAGMYNVYMPFIKRPRQGNLDVFLASSTSSRSYAFSSAPTSTTFVPQAAFRLVGVTCCIESSEANLQLGPLVSFELVKFNKGTQTEETIGTFECNDVPLKWKNGLKRRLCPVEELYQLLPNTTYTLRATPGPGVSIRLCRGNFMIPKGVGFCPSCLTGSRDRS